MAELNEPIVRQSASTGPNSPDVWGIYEPDTGSIQYICADPATKKAALIDVVLNFDPARFATDTRSMEQVLGLVEKHGLTVEWVLTDRLLTRGMAGLAEMVEPVAFLTELSGRGVKSEIFEGDHAIA